MKTLYKLLMSTALGIGLTAGAQAADTSVTINTRKVIYAGNSPPTVGILHATTTAASVSNGFTFDVPIPDGMTTANLVHFQGVAYTVSGSVKPLTMVRSGRTVTVSGSNMTSGTVQVGDVIRGIAVYQP